MLILDCSFVLTPTVLKQIDKMEKRDQEKLGSETTSGGVVPGDSGMKSSGGAIPKDKKSSKFGAIRSSLVGKSGSFKLGTSRKKSEDGSLPVVKEDEKKKAKKAKKQEKTTRVVEVERGAASSTGSQSSGGGSPTVKPAKTSKASSLVRKLSIGRYRQQGKPSPAPVSPELSPTMSKTGGFEDDLPSVASSTSTEGRQAPEGDDGTPFEETPISSPPISPLPVGKRPEGDDGTPFEETPISSPPISPPPAGKRDQSTRQVHNDQPDQSQEGRLAVEQTALKETASPLVEPHDVDKTLFDTAACKIAATTIFTDTIVPELPSTFGAISAQGSKAEIPAQEEIVTQHFRPSAFITDPSAVTSSPTEDTSSTDVSEEFKNSVTEPAVTDRTALMSKQVGGGESQKVTTRSQILSITAAAVKRHREEAASVEVEEPQPSSSGVPTRSEDASRKEQPEEEQFGDLEEHDQDYSASAMSLSTPLPSNEDSIAEARNRLSQSLESAAQQVAEKREHLYKILVIGELGTGKTSIIKRYVHQFFSQHYRATIGVDFALKVLNWDTNTIIRLQLWDIAGQERFGNMTRVYYKEAVGAFIVFDVTRAATFDAVVKWKQDLDAKVQLPDGSPIPCILLANKCDQQKEGIVNNSAKMDEYCKERGFSAWFETSAKENINIEDAARCLVTKILQNDRLIHHNDTVKDAERFALDAKNQKDQKNGKSCAC